MVARLRASTAVRALSTAHSTATVLIAAARFIAEPPAAQLSITASYGATPLQQVVTRFTLKIQVLPAH